MTEFPKTAIIVIFFGLEAGTTQSKPYNHIYKKSSKTRKGSCDKDSHTEVAYILKFK